MAESFEEAVQTIMRSRKVDERTAELIVADIYPALHAWDAGSRDDLAFDSVDDIEVPLYTPPVRRGRVVPIDDPRSPQGAIFAQAERLEAKRNGDRYRAMSRRAGGHYHD